MRILLAILLLTGCTVMGHRDAPVDWPRLKVIEHHVSSREMADVCYANIKVPMWLRLLGANLEGCALIYFDKKECHVWVSSDFPDARVLAHERLHCRGYDHESSSTLADAWKEWKRAPR